MPDGRVPWERAWGAACVTASLLVAARAIVARHLAVVDVASAYGAAGSLVVLLVWVNVSCLVVLLGGAFAFAWETVREPGTRGPDAVGLERVAELSSAARESPPVPPPKCPPFASTSTRPPSA